MGGSSSKGSSPATASAGSDFPQQTRVPDKIVPRSSAIILIQDTNSFPKHLSSPASSNSEAKVDQDDARGSSSSETQVYEQWKSQITSAAQNMHNTPAVSQLYPFEVTQFGSLDQEFAFKKQVRDDLVQEMQRTQCNAVIATHWSQYYLLGVVIQASQGSVFTIMADERVSKSGELRLLGVDRWGVHMMSHVTRDIWQALLKVCSVPARLDRQGSLECPYCDSSKLTQYELWEHLQLFHINIKDKNERAECPMCRQYISNGGLYVHMHDHHAPPGVHTEDGRPDIKLYSFGLCVIRRKKDGKFLVVQEYGNQGVWLPGGGIDAAELPWIGAQRECVEEAGVRVKILGVLRVEVSPSNHHRRSGGYCRMRYIFYGEPEDENDCEPKTIPDFESIAGVWMSLDELKTTRLRGYEPAVWFKAVADGCPIHPMSLFGIEGDTKV